MTRKIAGAFFERSKSFTKKLLTCNEFLTISSSNLKMSHSVFLICNFYKTVSVKFIKNTRHYF